MSGQSLAAILGDQFPTLKRYCPILASVSAPQALFLTLEAREALYGGAVGGGKSAAALMAALQYVDRPGYRALLLRRTFAELSKGDALIPLAHEWLGPTDARWNESRKTWTFPSGATLEFGHVQNEADRFAFQGAAYAFVGFDELTHFTEDIYTYIAFSRQRRRLGAAQTVPVRTRATANPGGVGHAWVKRRFIDKPKAGVFFVPAKVTDNPGLDAEDYAASLAHLPEELRRQLMDGDWGVLEYGAFPEFDPAAHVVERLEVPDGWSRFEAMDFGLNHPTAWLLVASDPDGNTVFADSYYRPALPSDSADEILARRKGGWGLANRAVADPSIWHRTGGRDRWGQPATIASEFLDAGVHLVPGNNDPRAGLTRLRELMRPDPGRPFPAWHPRAGEKGSPRLFVVRSTCPELVEQFQVAQLQPIDKRDGGEKVDPEWEGRHGHALAASRYAVLEWPAATPKRDEDEPEDWRAFRSRELLSKAEAARNAIRGHRYVQV